MTKRRSPMSAGDNATPVPCSEATAIPAPVPPNQAPTVVSIKKPSKVVPFSSAKPRFIASDEQSSRTIFGIGTQRFALDFSTRVTKLPPSTGDFPAPILPIKQHRKQNRPSSAKRDRTT
jgi:hypothetical protein